MNNKILAILFVLVACSGGFCFATGPYVLTSACVFEFDCDPNNSYIGVIMLVWSAGLLFVMPAMLLKFSGDSPQKTLDQKY